MLDCPAWKVHNPVKMLKKLPQEVLESAANNPEVKTTEVVVDRGFWYKWL